MYAYCRYSANPVGRLVLYLCGYSDAERQRLSDATCTALQLANFWQDVAVDLEKDRVYIPLEVLARHGYTLDDLYARRMTPAFREVMREIVARARELFVRRPAALRPWSTGAWRSISTCSAAAACACSKRSPRRITMCSSRRPAISKAERVWLLLGSLARVALSRAAVMTALAESYAHCRRVARTRARNFYYSFVLLSREQRDAMCAVYAFMRYCDDLSDEPGANRAAIEQWRTALDEALAGRYRRRIRCCPHSTIP